MAVTDERKPAVGNPLDFPEVLREAICWHEVFRKLGIPSADLFMNFGTEHISVVVRQGALRHGVIVGPRGTITADDARREWSKVVALWNATCNEDPRWDFEGSHARRVAVVVMAEMSLAGFTWGRS